MLLGLLTSPALQAAPACRELRQRRNELTVQAIQAEIALVIALRRRLCAREEAAAERAHAAAGKLTPEARPDAAPELDYAAYIRCRHQAEALLRRSRPVLHRNRGGFVFYTEAGAELARAADALQTSTGLSCPQPSRPEDPLPAGTPLPESRPEGPDPGEPPQRP